MKKIILLFFLFFASCKRNKETSFIKDSSFTVNKADTAQKYKEEIDSNFLSYWKGVLKIIETKNFRLLRENSLDSIEYYQKNIFIDDFLKSYNIAFDDTLLTCLADTSKVYFAPSGVEWYSSSKEHSQYNVTPVYEVYIKMGYEMDGSPILIRLKFIETKSGYKFYSYDRFG